MKKYNVIWIVPLLITMTGCESRTAGKPAALKKNDAAISITADKIDDLRKMERCRRELDALKKIDAEAYNKRKTEFDKLMTGASLYNGVRGDVGNYTQGAVDALYRFKADKLCADISSDMLNGLSVR